MADKTVRTHKNARNDLTAEFVRQAFDYNPFTGLLRWRKRPDRSAHWNSRYAGRTVGSPVRRGLSVNINKKRYLIHRIIWVWMTGEWPPYELDHKDVNYRNNRWDNLRPATAAQNMANQGIRSNNTSGYKGVSRKRDKWQVSICINRNHMNIGTYATKEEAAKAYIEATNRLNGVFARHS